MSPRRNQRFPLAGKVTFSWDQGSIPATARGTAQDICQNGLCITVREPLGFRSSASVRHIVRGVGSFKVGLELSQPFPARVLTAE